MKGILHYLKGVADYDLLYYRTKANTILHGFCDIDYVGDQDDNKSYMGYIFIFANFGIAWCSRCQCYAWTSNSSIES